MVKITNGIVTAVVPIGAYNGIFSRQGFHLVDETDNENVVGIVEDGTNEDAAFVAEIHEKPLSQWTKGEVRRYAAINGIDIAGTKNPSEAKQLIKDYMLEHSED